MRNQQEIKNEEKILEEELGLRTFFFVTIGVITIWGAFWYFIKDWKDRGTFGDMFGAINALFSGLALAGIIYTMLLQKQELRLQRLELKANREELARTATAQENSEKELKRQADNLKATARLTALSTLMEYYSRRAQENEERSRGVLFSEMEDSYSKIMDEAKGKYEEYKNEIEIILQGKS